MRLSRTSIQQAVAGATTAVGIGVFAANVYATTVSYDLRFAGTQPIGSESSGDGLHSLVATPGTYHLELWERTSGTNGTTADEGLINSYVSIGSEQLNGGIVASGGLANGQTATPFNDAATSRN